MKILLSSHKFYPDIGGIESVSYILADAFIRAGHSVRVVTKSIGDSDYDIKSYPFEIVRNPSIRKLLSCYKWADLVFQNNLEVRQLWPQVIFQKPLVITLQTWIRKPNGQRGLINKFKCLTLRLASLIISCSEAIRMDSSQRSIVIGNPYRDDLFRIDPNSQRERSIVFLGRLVSDKGADLLLQAYASINRPDWPLTIIGDGPERSALENLAKLLKIQSSVTFLGPLQGKELVQELNKHEVMVVPSIWREPFGIVVLEGLACGCVILASNGGGLPDATGSAGLLFNRGDLSDLSLKLNELLLDDDLRLQKRSRAASHLAEFHQDFICNRYLKEIEKLKIG